MDVLSLVLAAALAGPSASIQTQLSNAVRQFESVRPKIEREVGHDQAIDLGYRLVQDNEYNAPPSPGYNAADWDETVHTIVSLDTQAIADLAAGTPRPLTLASKGVFETFVPSSVNGTWLPVAIYIPNNVAPGAPLAIVLHGNPQSETELLGQPFFRRLADSTGTILAAPWGRGAYDFEGVATTDLYDVLAAVRKALHTDARRTYLVGYSMGGFTVFKVGPGHSEWAAIMNISGALLNSEVPNVRFAWQNTPVYVVTGKNDTSIPAVYGEETATFLASIGVPTAFYEQADGQHWIRSLVPALTRAWTDMHAGVVRADSVPVAKNGEHPTLPSIQTSSGYKP